MTQSDIEHLKAAEGHLQDLADVSELEQSFVDQYREALSRIEAATQWRPITEKPPAGCRTICLLKNGERGYWDDGRDGWMQGTTHWFQIPAAPEIKAG